MSTTNDNDHTFIVRVWCEPREMTNVPPFWRGTIEHISDDVSGDDKRAIQDIGEILDFIAPYLIRMNVKVSSRWRLRE